MDKSKFLVDVPFEFVDARTDKILCIAHGKFLKCVQLQKNMFLKGMFLVLLVQNWVPRSCMRD
jgi:hypothetical protein